MNLTIEKTNQWFQIHYNTQKYCENYNDMHIVVTGSNLQNIPEISKFSFQRSYDVS